MFPGVNVSNIFFLDNQKINKIDPNKYINKTNQIAEKKTFNNKLIKKSSNNENLNEFKLPIKKRVLKKYNSTTLKKGEINPFSKKHELVKKKAINYSQKC